MWIRLPLSCLQRKSNRPVRFIISPVDSAAESTGDMAIYWESPLTLLSAARAGRQLEKLRIPCLMDLFPNKFMLLCVSFGANGKTFFKESNRFSSAGVAGNGVRKSLSLSLYTLLASVVCSRP